MRFFRFFSRFRSLEPPWNTGQNFFFEKIVAKDVQNTFGYFWEQFWAFLEIWTFFDFCWKFSKTRTSMESWAKNCQKNRPKTGSKHIWTFLWTILGIFGFLRLFRLFSIFRRLDPPWKTGQKFFEQNAPKHVQITFGYFWERFWTFLEVWRFLYFFESFRSLEPLWNTGLRKFLKKSAPKLVQNTFGYFWERFWAFLEFWNFFDFFEIFCRLDLPWNTGQKFFEKIAPKHVQN